jgi:hypothetical protein
MRRKSKLFTGVFAGALALTLMSAISAVGQEKQVMIQRDRVFQGPDGPPPDHTFVFVSSEMNFDGKLVKGAPYSAQAVTETTQNLGDGNRIVNKSSAAVYRDSEGRTRREQSLRAMGPFATAGDSPQTIFINDPVAGVNYALDSRSMVARKMLPMKFEFKFDKTPDGIKSVGVASTSASKPPLPDRIEVNTGVFVSPSPAPSQRATTRVCEGVGCNPEIFINAPPPGADGANVVVQWHGAPEKRGKTESLGKQTIEGVEAEGTRNVITIPVGEIGNERPIEIVFERWYSPELQTVIMTRHIDPRFGETSYRLTNISRDEPARSLFEVPAGYTIKEVGGPAQQMRMKKPANNPE